MVTMTVTITIILSVCAIIIFFCGATTTDESHQACYGATLSTILILLPFAIAFTVVTQNSVIKYDFMQNRYIKKYEYVDSVKVDSTWVLKEEYGIK